jgi:hypothetical protein
MLVRVLSAAAARVAARPLHEDAGVLAARDAQVDSKRTAACRPLVAVRAGAPVYLVLLREQRRSARGAMHIIRALGLMAEDAITDEVVDVNPFRSKPNLANHRISELGLGWEQVGTRKVPRGGHGDRIDPQVAAHTTRASSRSRSSAGCLGGDRTATMRSRRCWSVAGSGRAVVRPAGGSRWPPSPRCARHFEARCSRAPAVAALDAMSIVLAHGLGPRGCDA